MLLLPYQVRHIVKKEKVTPTNPIDGVVSCPNTNRTSKKLAPGQLNRFYVMIGQLEIFWVQNHRTELDPIWSGGSSYALDGPGQG